jgi:hypothetical protein
MTAKALAATKTAGDKTTYMASDRQVHRVRVAGQSMEERYRRLDATTSRASTADTGCDDATRQRARQRAM